MSKTFHIGDILSCTTGRLLSPTGMSGIYEILNYMTGDDLMTHQLVRAAKVVEPVLKAAFPDLAGVTVPEFDGDVDKISAWFDEQVRIYGETREVEPLAVWQHRNPLVELAEMMDAG